MKLFLCAAAFGALAIGGFIVGANADGLSAAGRTSAATAPAGGATVIVPRQFAEALAAPAADAIPVPAMKPAVPAMAPSARTQPPAPEQAPTQAPAASETPLQFAGRLGQSIAQWFAGATSRLDIEYRYPVDVESAPDPDGRRFGRGRSEEV